MVDSRRLTDLGYLRSDAAIIKIVARKQRERRAPFDEPLVGVLEGPINSGKGEAR